MQPPLLSVRHLLWNKELLSSVKTAERPENKRGQESLEKRRRMCPEATEDAESGVEGIGADKAVVEEKETTFKWTEGLAGDAAVIIENLKVDLRPLKWKTTDTQFAAEAREAEVV